MQFVLDISSDSDSDLTMDTGSKVMTVDDPVPTTIKPEPVEGDAGIHLGMEPRSDTAQPKIKLEPDDEAEAQLTASIAGLEAALEAKVAAINASVAEAPNSQSALNKAALVELSVDTLADYLATRPFDAGERAKPALVTPAPPAAASAQSGVQRTTTHKDNRFHPYQAAAQPIPAAPPVQRRPTISSSSTFPVYAGEYNYYGLEFERIQDDATITIADGDIVIDHCAIWAVNPTAKMTTRNCRFDDNPYFKSQWPFVAEQCIFRDVRNFKANKNFTAMNCHFWPRDEDDRITMSRTAWNNCKGCVFHGEVYINKRPAWNGVTVDGNVLKSN